MAKPKINHQWSDETRNRGNYEVITGVSLTIPDQALTVKDLLDRQMRGLPLQGGKVPIYESEEEMEFPDLSKMDLSEIDELKRETWERINELRRQAATAKDKKIKELEKTQEKYDALKEKYEELTKGVEVKDSNTPLTKDEV